MRITFFSIFFLFLLLTTFNPKFNFKKNLNLNIKKIIIENNSVISDEEIIEKVSFLYDTNLFVLNSKKVGKSLEELSFIQSFGIKKIYPFTIKLKIEEKKLIAILQNKKEKFLFSSKGEIINFKKNDSYNNLPVVFGGEKNFFSFYENLRKINFPIDSIKSFYFFESGRWDLVLDEKKTIRLPISDYSTSLKNFMSIKKNENFNKHQIFDYRIKDQLILN
tara:strand:- start:473 stop:1132 length:660 start_codon:yes stop_codon:yes gene_type:complete